MGSSLQAWQPYNERLTTAQAHGLSDWGTTRDEASAKSQLALKRARLSNPSMPLRLALWSPIGAALGASTGALVGWAWMRQLSHMTADYYDTPWQVRAKWPRQGAIVGAILVGVAGAIIAGAIAANTGRTSLTPKGSHDTHWRVDGFDNTVHLREFYNENPDVKELVERSGVAPNTSIPDTTDRIIAGLDRDGDGELRSGSSTYGPTEMHGNIDLLGNGTTREYNARKLVKDADADGDNNSITTKREITDALADIAKPAAVKRQTPGDDTSFDFIHFSGYLTNDAFSRLAGTPNYDYPLIDMGPAQ